MTRPVAPGTHPVIPGVFAPRDPANTLAADAPPITLPSRPRPVSASQRPVFIVTLRPEPGVDPNQALRQASKMLLRRFGLRSLGIRELETTRG